MSREELLSQVLGLPREERARFAEDVLSSLEEPEPAIAEAWDGELESRARDLADGHIQPVDWEDVQAEMREDLKQIRANRPPS